MAKVWIIAGNAFREVLHQRLIYSVAFVAILIALGTVAPFAAVRMASKAGETKLAEQMRAGLLANVLGMWGFATMVLGVAVGSAAIAKEVRAKTIVTVLSRPVSRGEFLLGKLLGIQGFIAAAGALGIVGACALAWSFAVHLPLLFWFAALQMFVDAFLACAFSVALGAFIPRGVAAIAALFLRSSGTLARTFLQTPFGGIAAVAYYVAPAVMPIDLLNTSFGRELLDPQYGLYAAVLLENALYAGAVMVVAALLFKRREIRLG